MFTPAPNVETVTTRHKQKINSTSKSQLSFSDKEIAMHKRRLWRPEFLAKLSGTTSSRGHTALSILRLG